MLYVTSHIFLAPTIIISVLCHYCQKKDVNILWINKMLRGLKILFVILTGRVKQKIFPPLKKSDNPTLESPIYS